ncbi:MAG: hypothetical protein NTZ46_06070 [Verrucomicrobia bacterium]|nr:hypothetical protein [Verrucomicrobiota bacterium]
MKKTLPLDWNRWLKAKAPLLLCALLNGTALAGTLREQMQAELDSSPALAAQQVKMRVAEERQGSVTLEMTQGPKQLRDLFRKGYEINGSAFADWNLEPAALKALRSVRKTVHTLKLLPGVKEISLTGALDAAGEKNRDNPPLKVDSAPPANPATGALREQIQAELDSSPELAAQGMKLRVTYE